MAKREAEKLGIPFVTVACTSPQDIAPGVQALRAQGVGGIMQIPSIMIGGGFPALIKQARESGMPVVASNTGYRGRTALTRRELLRQRLCAGTVDDPRPARREPGEAFRSAHQRFRKWSSISARRPISA